jgi:hypothetical protein
MKFTMSRDRTVVSKFGRAIEFEKGVATHVPEMCYEEVMAAGGVPEDDLPEPEITDTTPQGVARTEAIVAAIKAMVLRGAREDFTAAGAPHAAALSAMAGFPVDAKERDAAWALAQTEAE